MNKILRMFGAQTYGTVVNTFDKLATVPLFFYFWGSALYGEWLILRAIPAYFAVAELGFATAAANRMSTLVIEKNKPLAQGYFNAAFLVITTFSILIMLIVFLIFQLVDIKDVFNFSAKHNYNLLLVTTLLLAYTLLIFQTQLISAAYRSVGRYVFAAYFTYHIRVAELICAVIILCLDGGVLAVAASYFFVRLAGCIIMSWTLLRKEEWLSYKIDIKNIKLIPEMLPNALGFLSFPVGQAMTLQGGLLVIANVFSPSAVALFSSVRTLTRTVVQFGMQINRSVWPEMTALYAKGDLNGAKNLYLSAAASFFWFSLVVSLILFFVSPYLFQIWTADKIIFDPYLFTVLLVAAVMNGYWYSLLSILSANDNHKKTAIMYLLLSFMFIPVSYLFAQEGSTLSVAWTVLLCDVLMLIIVKNYSLKQVNTSLLDFMRYIFISPCKISKIIKKRYLK